MKAVTFQTERVRGTSGQEMRTDYPPRNMTMRFPNTEDKEKNREPRRKSTKTKPPYKGLGVNVCPMPRDNKQRLAYSTAQ